MYLKPQDKYISINTDKFNIFAPVADFDRILLYNGSDSSNLYIYCRENDNGFCYLNKPYDSLLKLYLQIISQFNNLGFIDITCGKNHAFLRQDSIMALTRNTPRQSTKQIIELLYKAVPSDEPELCSIQLVESENDLTQEYMDVLGQISYRPRNTQVSTPGNNFNKSTFWNSKGNFNIPTPKEPKEINEIEEGWCFIN